MSKQSRQQFARQRAEREADHIRDEVSRVVGATLQGAFNLHALAERIIELRGHPLAADPELGPAYALALEAAKFAFSSLEPGVRAALTEAQKLWEEYQVAITPPVERHRRFPEECGAGDPSESAGTPAEPAERLPLPLNLQDTPAAVEVS